MPSGAGSPSRGLSREAAAAVIDHINEDNGGISKQQMSKLPPSVQRTIENLRRKLGSATKTLAQNLYSKDTRFIFELIQNAEDNFYTVAHRLGQPPFIEFAIYPDRIVIDSNEDGFTEANVRAICSTGQSTKTSTQGYIGEKGIGFKSVFKVASRVHIQSGPFSFVFEHEQDDSGLGMVTPYNHPHEESGSNFRTRIVLYFSDPTKYSKHSKELLELPDTLLLFLRQIKQLQVKVYDGSGLKAEQFYGYRFDPMREIGTVSKGPSVNAETSFDRYRIRKNTVKDLPHHQSRHSISQAEVVLAFPIDADGSPIVVQQHTFAYLPLRKVGLKFVIQSDFITQASREDLLESDWNDALLKGVADTFHAAVDSFCSDTDLQYSWLRYFPDESITDPFWSTLRNLLRDRLRNASVFRTWTGKALAKPSCLRTLPEFYLDKRQQPLLLDSNREYYCSSKYDLHAKPELLAYLGIPMLGWSDILDRINADLSAASSTSRIRSSDTTDEWHTRFSKLLLRGKDEPTSPSFQRHHEDDLRALPIIPIIGGKWTSIADKQVFFPQIAGVDIPHDLNITLVDPPAIRNHLRKKVFEFLGTKNLSEATVIKAIQKRYVDILCQRNRVSLKPEDGASHLRFLFHSQSGASLTDLCVVSDQNTRGATSDAYLSSTSEYDAKMLFRPHAASGAPGTVRHFLHPAYLDGVSDGKTSDGLSYIEWLNRKLGIHAAPKLSTSAHTDFTYIATSRSDMFIGTLKAHMQLYTDTYHSEAIQTLFRGFRVPCEDGTSKPLGETFVPVEELRVEAQRLGVSDLASFLSLPSNVSADTLEDIELLSRFSVGSRIDLEFYLSILKEACSRQTNPLTWDSALKIYKGIAKLADTNEDHQRLRLFFAQEKAFCVCAAPGSVPTWLAPADCVWDVSYEPRSFIALAKVSKYDDPLVRILCRDILGVQDANWHHSVAEIKAMANSQGGVDKGHLGEVYHHLFARPPEGDAAAKSLRDEFEAERLVCVDNTTPNMPRDRRWKPPSVCLWAKSTSLPNRFAIANLYERSEKLFVNTLDVPVPDAGLMVKELRNLVKGPRNLDFGAKVKQLLQEISGMELKKPSMKILRDLAFLPVKEPSGLTKFVSASAEFAIVDRQHYYEAFGSRISLLDYKLEEVQKLEPLIEALDLQARCLSVQVKSKTAANGRRSPERTSFFREKALSIARCAVHYDIKRARLDLKSLYVLFATAEVYPSDEIIEELSITQNGSTFEHQSLRGKLHLEEAQGRLKIYEPKDPQALEVCMSDQLPRRICRLMESSNTKLELILTRILGTKSPSVMDEYLHNSGVGRIDELTISAWKEEARLIIESSVTEASISSFQSSSASNQTPALMTPEPMPQPRVLRTPEQRHGVSTERDFTRADGLQTPIKNLSAYSPPVLPQAAANSEYRKLLDRLIKNARRDDVFDLQELQDILDADDADDSAGPLYAPFGLRELNPFAHDSKVGAAGELYVFEILSQLGLHGFSRDNWKSRIRKEVRVHEEYHDLQPWHGAEQADIMYKDERGELTSYLLEKGFVDDMDDDYKARVQRLKEAKPQYYIEVKTTTKPWDEKFFVSKSQYSKMCEQSLRSQTRPAVYIIFRVYSLGKQDMDIDVYFDPREFERQGGLEFTTETYTVVPKPSPLTFG